MLSDSIRKLAKKLDDIDMDDWNALVEKTEKEHKRFSVFDKDGNPFAFTVDEFRNWLKKQPKNSEFAFADDEDENGCTFEDVVVGEFDLEDYLTYEPTDFSKLFRRD